MDLAFLPIASLAIQCVSINMAPTQEVYERSLTSENSTPFRFMGASSTPQKIIDCDDGYVYYYTEIYKTEFTSNSDLFLVKVTTSFTGGHTARQNGTLQSNGKQYKDYYLKRGYIHATLVVPSDGSNHGANIYPKQYWPRSNDVQMNISSSVGGESTMPSEFSGMVNLGNGASIGAKRGNSLTYKFSLSTSYVTADPIMSAQYGSTSDEVQWSFQVSSIKSPAASMTYTLDSYILFEMDKNYSGYNRNAFTLNLNFLYAGQFRNFFGVWDGWEFKGGHSIACFHQ